MPRLAAALVRACRGGAVFSGQSTRGLASRAAKPAFLNSSRIDSRVKKRRCVRSSRPFSAYSHLPCNSGRTTDQCATLGMQAAHRPSGRSRARRRVRARQGSRRCSSTFPRTSTAKPSGGAAAVTAAKTSSSSMLPESTVGRRWAAFAATSGSSSTPTYTASGCRARKAAPN